MRMVGLLFFAVFGNAATPVEQHRCRKRAFIFGPASGCLCSIFACASNLPTSHMGLPNRNRRFDLGTLQHSAMSHERQSAPCPVFFSCRVV